MTTFSLLRMLSLVASVILFAALHVGRPRMIEAGYGRVFHPLALAAGLLVMNSGFGFLTEIPEPATTMWQVKAIWIPLGIRVAACCAVLMWLGRPSAAGDSSEPSLSSQESS